MIEGFKVEVAPNTRGEYSWQITKPGPDGVDQPFDVGDRWCSETWIVSGTAKTAQKAHEDASKTFGEIARYALYQALNAEFKSVRPATTVTT